MVQNQLLIRHIKNRWLRQDNTITSEAYRPRERDITPENPTGYEKNVSTQLKNCYPTNTDLENLKNQFDRTVLYEINSNHPNDRGYPCIQAEKGCHVGITGDMANLANDYQTLEILAKNSSRLYPI